MGSEGIGPGGLYEVEIGMGRVRSGLRNNSRSKYLEMSLYNAEGVLERQVSGNGEM
jgi:hypothetical protein